MYYQDAKEKQKTKKSKRSYKRKGKIFFQISIILIIVQPATTLPQITVIPQSQPPKTTVWSDIVTQPLQTNHSSLPVTSLTSSESQTKASSGLFPMITSTKPSNQIVNVTNSSNLTPMESLRCGTNVRFPGPTNVLHFSPLEHLKRRHSNDFQVKPCLLKTKIYRISTEITNFCPPTPTTYHIDTLLDPKYKCSELAILQQGLQQDLKSINPRMENKVFETIRAWVENGVTFVQSGINQSAKVDNTIEHYMDSIWVFKKQHQGVIYRAILYQHFFAPNNFTLFVCLKKIMMVQYHKHIMLLLQMNILDGCLGDLCNISKLITSNFSVIFKCFQSPNIFRSITNNFISHLSVFYNFIFPFFLI